MKAGRLNGLPKQITDTGKTRSHKWCLTSPRSKSGKRPVELADNEWARAPRQHGNTSTKLYARVSLNLSGETDRLWRCSPTERGTR